MKTPQKNEAGFSLVELLLILAVVAVAGLIGWLVWQTQNTTTNKDSATSSQSGAKVKQAEPPKDPTAGWKQYYSEQENAYFKYPTDWTAKDIGAVDPAGDGIELDSPNGTILQWQSTVSGLGGSCDPDTTPHIYINKSIPLPAVPGLYVVELGGKDAVTNRIGIVDGKNQAYKVGDTG